MADAFQPKFVDLVRNYSTTTGTDDFILGPAVNGFASFTSGCAAGDSFYYSALGVDYPTDTEVGRGTLLAGGVISRDPIDGNKTNFKSGTKTIALVAAAEWYSQLDAARAGSGPTNVKSFGAVGDGVTDDTAAIQGALDYLGSIGGGALYFPEGAYLASSYLTLHPRTVIRGAGRLSSKIVSTHVGGNGATAGEDLRNGSGLVTSSPINSSTPVHIVLEDIGIENSNSANVGAAYYDTGGTYIAARNVVFAGFKYGVVLDQSELVDLDLCEIAAQNDGGAGVWIVNGSALTPGVAGGYCNRIAVKRCQINESGSVIGIADDGGYAHVFEDNNYNGCLNHIRAAGAILDIRGGEFESAASDCVRLSSLSVAGGGVGGCRTAIRGGLFAATDGNASVLGVDSPGTLQVDGLAVFSGGGGASPISGSGNFAGLWLLSYANNSASSSVKDGNGQWVDVDGNSSNGFQINGVTCYGGSVSASNIGSAASHDAGDFLQPANNLSEIASAAAAAKNLGGAYVLDQNAAPTSHTGDTAEAVLANIQLAANAMGVNGRIEVKARFSWSNSANLKTIKVKFGGTAIENVSQTTNSGIHVAASIANRGVANSQDGYVARYKPGSTVDYVVAPTSIDTGQATTISITGQLANATETVTLESYQVILYPKD
jgi:hypothetical protein